LEALPAEGYKLDRWIGGSGSGNSISIKVDGSMTVTANFILAVQERSAQQAKDMLDANKGLIVMDVSSVGNFDAGHILCARNYPWNGNFGGGIAEMNPYKNRELLLYDQNGSRSEAAADALISQGFTSLYLISGGLNAWKSQGYEVIPTSCNCEDCSLPPMAFAGADQKVGEDETVKLNASGSRDPDGGNLTYHWEQTDGNHLVEIVKPNTARPEFTSPYVQEGGDTLIFRVTVTDNKQNKDMDSVRVHVDWFNDPPVAGAGADLTIGPGHAVVLDGSGSFDVEGGLSCSWMATAGTMNGFSISDNAALKTVFRAPNQIKASSSFVELELTVRDNGGKVATDTIKVTMDDNIDCIPAQLSSSLELYIPSIQYHYNPPNGTHLIWARMEFAKVDDKGNFLWLVKEYGFNEAYYSTSECETSTLSNKLALNLPNITYNLPEGPLSLWAHMDFAGQDGDGNLLFQLKSHGIK